MELRDSLGSVEPQINPINFQSYLRPVKVIASNGLGFTLIEILVVVAVIALLASVLLVAFNNTRINARMAKRKSDARQVRKAIEFYFQDNGFYPNKGQAGNQNTAVDIQKLAGFLEPKYLSALPNDPKDNPKNYEYIWDNKGQDYGLLIPFSDDGGQDCMFKSPNGSANWFKVGNKKVPDCNYNQ